MNSADVQLIDRIRLQKHVPRAGGFEASLFQSYNFYSAYKVPQSIGLF